MLFTYHYGPGLRQEGQCLANIVEMDGVTYTVFSELAGNPGMSITNAAEYVACEFFKAHPELDPRRVEMLEHYGPFSYTGAGREDDLSRMAFRICEPLPFGLKKFEGITWSPVPKATQQQLLEHLKPLVERDLRRLSARSLDSDGGLRR